MRHCIYRVFVFCLMLTEASSQNFTWMRGSEYGGAFSTYGTQGAASVSNDPGGRHGSATWTDTLDNLWLFGGEGYLNNTTTVYRFNDLWKYTTATNEWTWMSGATVQNTVGSYGTQGVASPTNTPGARDDAASWVDKDGYLYLFGGFGYAATNSIGYLSDLWRYNPYTQEWTWLKGSNGINQNGVYGSLGVSSTTNSPGARQCSTTWTDANGDFWLFGGRGYPASGSAQLYLNDLWKYTVSSNTWTWINGSTGGNVQGAYGTLGVTSSANYPGSRQNTASWTGDDGQLYLFGGTGYSTGNLLGYMNDLWRYDLVTNTWTWIKGTNLGNQHGIYGVLHTASITNLPGGRDNPIAWKDKSGDFWLMGGDGYEVVGVCDRLNDLFRYTVASNTWTWIKGANFHNQNGTYGTQGVPAAANVPGARHNTISWNKGSGKRSLWLFGGWGMDALGNLPYHLNDLWKFDVPCNPDSLKLSSTAILCHGDSLSISAFNQIASSTLWYASATSTLSIGAGTNFNTSLLQATGNSSVYTFYAESNSCTLSPRASVSITVQPVPTLSISSTTPLICKGQTATLSVQGATSYSWTNLGTTSLQLVSPIITTTYNVSGTFTTGCSSKSVYVQGVNACVSLEEISGSAEVKIFPNPANDNFFVLLPENSPAERLVITDVTGKVLVEQSALVGENKLHITNGAGLYFVSLYRGSARLSTYKLIATGISGN